MNSLLAGMLLTGVLQPAHAAVPPSVPRSRTPDAIHAMSSDTAKFVATNIAMGDREYAALHPAAALAHYTAAIAADPNSIDALWKASRTAIVLGTFSDATRDTMYKIAEVYSRRAVRLDSMNANAQYAVAQALGHISLTISGPQARLPYGQEIYRHVTACLARNPRSAECAYILGVWNAEVMRINDVLRSQAIALLGATELANASWSNAQHYLQQAIAAQPQQLMSRVALARVYVDMGKTAQAKAEYQTVLQLPAREYNDPQYKATAKNALTDLESK